MADYTVDVPQATLDELVRQAERDGIQKAVAGALIFREGKVLLLVRAMGEFMEGLTELPRGSVEPGESLVQGLAREVAEETGLGVSRISDYIDSFDYESGSGKRARQFNFRVEVFGEDEIRLNTTEHGRSLFADPRTADWKALGVSEATEGIIRKCWELVSRTADSELSGQE
jgi:8-oxo-dGTP diphosphatase